MKKIIKYGLLIFIVSVLVLSVVSCNGTVEVVESESQTSRDTLFDEPTDISIMIMSHPSWPFNSDWAMWKYIKEATGAKINFKPVPNSEFYTKLTLVMTTPNELPDLATIDYKLNADNYAEQGALIAIDDYLHLMPNYTAFWDSIPEEERNELLLQRKSIDGKTYYPQNYGMGVRQNLRSWLHRKDIFDKHGLKTPTTMDELYQVSLKLKEIYPDSYPWCLRSGIRNIGLIGPSWKEPFTYNIYYDYKNDKWSYGLLEEVALDQVKFMLKMYQEKLIPPDYLTITSKSWEELVSTDRGFILTDYTVRVDSFTSVVKKNNPDFKLEAFIPPVANQELGAPKVWKFNVDPKGYIIFNTKDDKRIENAIRFVDWFYSDEAVELVSWGKEGETYEMIDGERRYIMGEVEDLESKYGRFSYGTYLRVDPEAAISGISETQRQAVEIALDTMTDIYNPSNWLAFNNEDKIEVQALKDNIDTYVNEMLSKFLLGQEPLTNWDAFVESLRDLGVEELVQYYSDAYSELTE